MSNLPKRYAYAVTSHLPQAQREEVAKELEATIEDMASDRAKSGKPTEKDIKQVLYELGNPAILAHKYRSTKRYLIGPKWYDAWLQLLKTLLAIVPGIVAAVILAVDLAAQGNQPIMSSIVHAVGTGIMVGIHITFWVTLVFAFLERAAIKPEEMGIDAWSPDTLPELPANPNRQVGLIESVANAALIAIGAIWLALSPIIHNKDGEQLFNPELWNVWAPIVFVLAALSFIHKLILVKVGNWTTPLMVTNLLLLLAGTVFVLTLVTTQQVLNPGYFEAWNVQMQQQSFDTAAKWITGISAASIVAVNVWEAVQAVVLNRRLKKRSSK